MAIHVETAEHDGGTDSESVEGHDIEHADGMVGGVVRVLGADGGGAGGDDGGGVSGDGGDGDGGGGDGVSGDGGDGEATGTTPKATRWFSRCGPR